MSTSTQEIESFAKTAWPHVARVSVDAIVGGRQRRNEFDPLESGFTLTAYDAQSSIVKRISAATLDLLKDKIDQQLRKKAKTNGTVKL
jgi:hypothetical protein